MGSGGKWCGRVVTVALLAGLTVSVAAAATPIVYRSPAKALIPSPTRAGYDAVAFESAKAVAAHPKPGLRSSWTRDYKSDSNATMGAETIGVMVFGSEAQAHVQ